MKEESLNVSLAELLAERGLRALGEVSLRGPSRGSPDVLMVVNGVRIVLEGKRPGHRAELVRQAVKRIEDGVCEVAVIVEYVEVPLSGLVVDQRGVKEALARATFNVGVVTLAEAPGLERFLGGGRRPEVAMFEGADFHDLVTVVMQAYERAVSEDLFGPVVARMEETLRRFSARLADRVDAERLREALELRRGGEAGDE